MNGDIQTPSSLNQQRIDTTVSKYIKPQSLISNWHITASVTFLREHGQMNEAKQVGCGEIMILQKLLVYLINNTTQTRCYPPLLSEFPVWRFLWQTEPDIIIT